MRKHVSTQNITILLLIFILSGCSTLQTKGGDYNNMGNPYSGTKKVIDDFEDGPDNDHHFGPSGAIGVGALFIPISDFISGTIFYLIKSIDMASSIVLDTALLPIDLVNQDQYYISEITRREDIKSLIQAYKINKITEPSIINAVVKADYSRIKAIIENSPESVNIPGPLGYNALFYAAAINDIKSIDILIASGAELKPSNATVVLTYLSEEETLLQLLENVDIDPTQVASRGRFFRSSNLITAALHNEHYYLAKNFIQMDGVDIDHRDSDGRFPLLYSILLSDMDTTLELLKKGASLNEGERLMRAALWLDDLSFFNLLLTYKVKVPSDAILIAVRKQSIELTEQLLNMGVDINIFDTRNQDSLLHKASRKDDSVMIRFLIKKGMNINLENINGYTPLCVAAKDFKVNAVRTLLKLGSNHSLCLKSALGGYVPEEQRVNHDIILKILTP